MQLANYIAIKFHAQYVRFNFQEKNSFKLRF